MPTILRSVAAAILILGATADARAADVPYEGEELPRLPGFGGGGSWAPRLAVRPPPVRYDIYGYPLPGSGLVGRPAPHALGVGCPVALRPAYDPDGNLAGYAPVQDCR